VGVLMDLMLCYGGTTAPRRRKLVDVRYRARGPRRGLVCVAFLTDGGGAVWMGVQRPFWRSETIALLRRGRGHGRAAERENDPL
jgi:hypothetical protein